MNPFTRTTCACDICVANCKRQPGCLAPGDAERIIAATGKNPKEILVASPGALAMDARGKKFRIGTITPASVKGRCIFLGPDDRCQIHAVAPFGCSHFDCKTSFPESQRRSVWVHTNIMHDQAYQHLRSTLPLATHYNPNPY